MRCLLTKRLSRLVDGATGFEKQDEAGERYVAVHDHEIVATAADSDVSGSIAPKARPELGPWLTEPAKIAQYDEIVAAYLDRLGRNARHLAELRDWCEDHGKRLTVVSPPLHWPPDPEDLASPIIWDVLGRLAEYELAAITKRNRDTVTWLQANDYLTGKPPYGYRIIPKGDHKGLEPDPALIPVLRAMVERSLAGESLTAICKWLDGESPARNGGLWATNSVVQILRNPILYGRRKAYTAGKKPTGRTLLKVDPVIDYGTWKRLQAHLDATKQRRGAPAEQPAMLTGVVYCARTGCERRMYHFESIGPLRKDGTRNRHHYYRCAGPSRGPSTCKNLIRMDDLDKWVSNWFDIGEFGRLPLVERVVTPGNGHEHEIEQVGQDMQELTAQYAADDIGDDQYDRAMTKLRAERSRLRDLPAEPDQIEDTPTGQTVREHWQSLDTPGRREFLLAADLKVYAEKIDGRISAKLIPGDLDAFESTMKFGKRGVASGEPWKRDGARLVVPS